MKPPYRDTYLASKENLYTDTSKYLADIEYNNYNSQLIMYLPRLLRRQKFKCYVTGQILVPHEFHIHHIKPLSAGGNNNLNNLVLIDKKVHKELHSSRYSCYTGEFLRRFERLKNYLQ